MQSHKKNSIISLVSYKQSMLHKVAACFLILCFSINSIAFGYDKDTFDRIRAVESGKKDEIDVIFRELGKNLDVVIDKAAVEESTSPSGMESRETAENKKAGLRKLTKVMIVSSAVLAVGFAVNYLWFLTLGTSIFQIFAKLYLSSLLNRLVIGGLVASIIGALSELTGLYLSDNPSQRWRLKSRFTSYSLLKFVLGAITALLYLSLEYFIPGASPVKAIVSLFFGMGMGSTINLFFQRYFALDWARYQTPDVEARTGDEYSYRSQWDKTLYAIKIRLPLNFMMHDLIQNYFSEEARILVNFFIASYFMSLIKNYMPNLRDKPSWNPKIVLFISIAASSLSFIFGTWTMGAITIISAYIIYRHFLRSLPGAIREDEADESTSPSGMAPTGAKVKWKSKKPAILFVKHISRNPGYSREANLADYLTIGSMASALKNKDFLRRYADRSGKHEYYFEENGDYPSFDIHVIDLAQKAQNATTIENFIDDYIKQTGIDPIMVCVSSTSAQLDESKEVAAAAARLFPDALRIIGGPHVSV